MGIESYRAKVARKGLQAGSVPDDDYLVIKDILRNAGVLKREEIVDAFFRRQEIDRDIASQAVSTALRTMVKRGMVKRVKTGYYELV